MSFDPLTPFRPPARRWTALVAVAALLLVIGIVWRRDDLAPEPLPADGAVRSEHPTRRPARRARRTRPAPARPPEPADLARTFHGQPGWLVLGRATRGEDETMWAARKLEGRGIEATALRGDLFAGLDAETTYVIHGGFKTRPDAEARQAELKKRGLATRVVNSGAIRPAAGEEGDSPKRLTAVRGIVTDDGEPAAYHVARRMEGAPEQTGQLDAMMPDSAGYFFFWTNQLGIMNLSISLPLELDDLKDSGEGASVVLDDAGPAVLDVVLEVESKPPAEH